MIKSIFLAVDGSAFTNAVVEYGMDLAEKLHAFLRVYSVIDIRIYEWVLNTGGEGYMPVVPSNVFHDESFKFHSERAEVLIETLRKKLKERRLTFEADKLEGDPVEVICEISRQVDLVIMGARGDYARWGDRLLGATVESVSRQIHAPLLISGQNYKNFRSIICAYDRSEASNTGLKLSANLSEQLDLPLEVVAIHEDELVRNETLTEARIYLEPYKLASQFRHEVGDPAKTLIQVTQDVSEPALLVMGSFGHSRIREAILGSTTVQVMRRANKPILLAK